MERPKFFRRFVRQQPKPIEQLTQVVPQVNIYLQAEFTQRPQEVVLGTLVDQAIHNFRHPKYKPDGHDFYSLETGALDAMRNYDLSPIDMTRQIIQQSKLTPEETEIHWDLQGTTFDSWNELCDAISRNIIAAEMIMRDPQLQKAQNMRLDLACRLWEIDDRKRNGEPEEDI